MQTLSRLEGIVRDRGGRIYLAKDCCLSREGFREMYPDLERFLEIKSVIDPNERFASTLSDRLGITGRGLTE